VSEMARKREQQAARASDSRKGESDSSTPQPSPVLSAVEQEVTFEDFGLSRDARKVARERGLAAAVVEEDDFGEEEQETGDDSWAAPPALLSDVERIRLPRQRLEQWQMEPFFERVVIGCLVRIGIDQAGTKLYRVAEVVGVDENAAAYTLGPRRTCKQLHLDFGECRQAYPMNVVSNGSFDPLELQSWGQVLEAFSHPPISQVQLARKCRAIEQANNYSYSEEEVGRMVQAELQQKAVLTTRQKLAAQHRAESAGQSDMVARPMKFQRNVLGQAIVGHDEDE